MRQPVYTVYHSFLKNAKIFYQNNAVLCREIILKYSKSKYPLIPTGCLTNIKRAVHGLRQQKIERQWTLNTPKDSRSCPNMECDMTWARPPQCVNELIKFQRNHGKYLHPDAENAKKNTTLEAEMAHKCMKIRGERSELNTTFTL